MSISASPIVNLDMLLPTAAPHWVGKSDELRRLQKRVRQRGYVKNAYNKQKETVGALVVEVEALEKQYQALREPLGLLPPVGPRARHVAILPAHSSAPARKSLRERYLELTALRQYLYDERSTLYNATIQYEKLVGRLQQIMDMQPQSWTDGEQRFLYRPLDHCEYFAVVEHTRQYVLQFLNDATTNSSGVDVLGWTDLHKLEGKRLDFALEKQFPQASAHELLTRTWAVITDPTQYEQLYSQAAHPKIALLETVNERTLLAYWAVDLPSAPPVSFKSIVLLTWLPVANDGFLILFRSIDRDRLSVREHQSTASTTQTTRLEDLLSETPREDRWGDLFSWIFLQGQVGGACRCHFGGTSEKVWLVEVVLIALRWEALAVGRLPLLVDTTA